MVASIMCLKHLRQGNGLLLYALAINLMSGVVNIPPSFLTFPNIFCYKHFKWANERLLDWLLCEFMCGWIIALPKCPQNQTQENELRIKERQIQVLEDKLCIAEKARKNNVNPSDIKDLETHCLLLQQQVGLILFVCLMSFKI